MSEPACPPEPDRADRDLTRLVRASADASPAGWIRLSANECAFPPSPVVLQALAGAADGLNRYPDPEGEPLRSALAEHHGVAVDQVLVSHGADGVLAACFRAFCAPGSAVALLDPTYPFLYNLAEIGGAEIRLASSADDLLTAANSGVHLTVLVNPNNPTGDWLPPERFLDRVPDVGVMVVDEAYASFSPRSALTYLGDRPNVLVVRSFSKSYGLAGLRLGYAVGSAPLIARLSAVQDPYPISSLAVAAGIAVLRDHEYYRRQIETVVTERNRLTSGLRALGWRVPQSYANFVFGVPPPGSLGRCLDLLASSQIHVRTFARAAHGLRITVGMHEENEAVLQALAADRHIGI